MTKSEENSKYGHISAINGSIVEVKGLEHQIKLHDLIKISNHNILSEVIQIYSDRVVTQCLESTMNLKLYEKVETLNEPLLMELGPGLLSKIFDGIQRPLEIAFKNSKEGRMEIGREFPSLSRTKKWFFVPKRKLLDEIRSGDMIGVVQETPLIEHKIIAPHDASGALSFIASEGEYTITEELYRLKESKEEKSFSMLQKWPITKRRPYKRRLTPTEPLFTGIRFIDFSFPIAKGGTIAVPGGFGTGKSVIQQSIAKFCNADVIVFICCGEPGNDIAYILKEFAETIDPFSGRPLLERIVILANTSNMPVSAREASLFSGVTIAEYYRDMGYDVAVIADSTSRWAESLRELSCLLEEMPAEEGYPAYLPSKISSFYERAGVVNTLGEDLVDNEIIQRTGSLTIIGSISPPSGDFNEPVTAATKRVVQGMWALDASLAYLKHYPAINWLNSYSMYPEYVFEWWKQWDIDWPEIQSDWLECRKQIIDILNMEHDLKKFTQLIEVSEEQKFELFIAHLIHDYLLTQNAYDDIDKYTDAKKLMAFVKIILFLYMEGKEFMNQDHIIDDFIYEEIENVIKKINNSIPNNEIETINKLKSELKNKFLKRGIIIT